MGESGAERQSFYLFPYLQTDRKYRVGPFSVVPLDPVKLAAATQGSGVTIRSLLARMRDPEGNPLATATLIQRMEEELPAGSGREFEREALQAAISFAVTDSNAPFGNHIPWGTMPPNFATTEVSSFKIIQVEALETGRFFRQRGGINHVKVWMGGNIHDDTTVLEQTPEGLVAIPTVKLDEELMQAVYAVVFEGLSNEQSPDHAAVHSALHWHARAWENGPLHTVTDAIVQLKTAIEALSGEHQTRKGISTLEQIYAAIEGTLGRTEYLWTSVMPRFKRVYQGKTTQFSSFGQWYWFLSDARNDIVHSALAPTMGYNEEIPSPFAGNLLHIGERVTRELIKIRIAQLGYPRAALSPRLRRLLDHPDTRFVRINSRLISPLEVTSSAPR